MNTQRKLPLSTILWYSSANLGYGMFFAFNNAVIGPFLKKYTANAILLGLMSSSHSFEGIIIQPVTGALSDRLKTSLGRRRPYLIVFIPLSVLFLLLMPAAEHLTHAWRLAALIADIFLFTMLFNIAFDPYQALMPDITPENQRGNVTAIWAFLGLIGQAALLLLPLKTDAKIYLTAVVMIITTAAVCLAVHEPPPPEMQQTHRLLQECREGLRGLNVLIQAKNGLWVFFFSGVAIGSVLPYLTLYIESVTHCSHTTAEHMFFVIVAFTALFVLPAGRLTDRLGAQRVLAAGLYLVLLASLAGLIVHTLQQIEVVLAVAGLGNAALSAATYPMLTLLVPQEEQGFYSGLQTAAASLAQPATLVVTGMLINHGSYRYIFVVCAAGLAAALVFLGRLKPERAPDEIEARRFQLRESGV